MCGNLAKKVEKVKLFQLTAFPVRFYSINFITAEITIKPTQNDNDPGN